MADDSPLKRWSTMLLEAFRSNGRALDTALHYEKQLSEAGFVNVKVIQEKWPINRWPRDPRYKQLGKSRPPPMILVLGSIQPISIAFLAIV
ncbi:hypothetical protein IMZ48_21765 [Candidatus Bathyarchaeota archaeon]|nr:hypothetical protein [Candidatus Bathyarchaeota archaeon]